MTDKAILVNAASINCSLSRFFGLVFIFSVPFYALGILAPQLGRLMPFGLPSAS